MFDEAARKPATPSKRGCVARVPVKAGPHAVGAAFVQQLPLGDTRRLQPFLRSSADTLDWTGLPHIQSLTITGPFNATGPGDTPSRRRIFTCRPAGASAEPRVRRRRFSHAGAARVSPAGHGGRSAAAARVLRRGPRARGAFDTGIQRALQRDARESAVHVPRRARSRQRRARRASIALGDLELASRLSFFLWSSIPDDELLIAAASQGKLKTSGGARARRCGGCWPTRGRRRWSSNFAGQWLQLRNVKSVQPNSDEFPDFDDNLRQSFRARDRAVLREHHARGPQRARPAARPTTRS